MAESITGPDYWTDHFPTKNDKELTASATFVHYGKMYRLNEKLETICCGPVADSSPKPHEKPPVKQNDVAKPITQGLLAPPENQGGVLQQKNPAGRPKKLPGQPMHRATAWRRKKEEEQGVLL